MNASSAASSVEGRRGDLFEDSSGGSDVGLQTLMEAIAFAARVHHGATRKDGRTPYVSHVARVTLVVRHVFGIADEQVLCAAALHDVLEDTATDFDDVAERFGTQVARWVAVLSKDSRLPEPEREEAYRQALSRSPWQVRVVKLADMLDNLYDRAGLPTAQHARILTKLEGYLDALRVEVGDPAREAWEMVRERLARAREAARLDEGGGALQESVS